MAKKPPDWTRTGTVSGYAEYLRRQSDAICVVVVRPADLVLALDPRCKPSDAERLVGDYLPLLVERMEQPRKEKKPAARLELGKNRE